ncbi:hypothetical protein BKA65DRAFT_77255 [Rhexocercosporidium sp. MPI-PUGE-AT-0058]|nr:hypothetical protein BKA65DRAFT_77255 [Rhexocercosporidium sp. MPI-PUGE-AT-0058]
MPYRSLSLNQDDTVSTESAWPADRTPGRLDAEQANQPIENSFMQSYKDALLRDEKASETVEYLNDDSEASISGADPPNTTLSYPLVIFSRFPTLPPREMLQSFVDVFVNDIYPTMPLLYHIPVESLQRSDNPPYLTYAIATIGSLVLGADQSLTEDLWWAANFLIAGILEIDNREARKVELLNAWVLLEAYGALSADPRIWQKTNITHGYVETAARRLFLSFSEHKGSGLRHDQDENGQATNASNCAAMPAFVLTDMLRSLHYNLPQTLSTSEFLTHLSAQHNHMNDKAASRSSSHPAVLRRDDSLLGLVAILGDIHTLSTVFHLLELVSPYDGQQDKDLNFTNPYLPFSPPNENHKTRRKLQKALDIWRQNYLAIVDQDVAALFYFCQMYLVLPSLLLLPEIVGYAPRSSSDTTQINHRTRILDADLANGSEALKNAWLILENITQSENLPSLWLPIVLFYASLVAWRMVRLQTGTSEAGTSGLVQVLQLFKSQLEQLRWPCCQSMTTVLQSLMAADRHF